MSSIDANIKISNNEVNDARRKHTEKKQLELKKIDDEAKRQEADLRMASESTKQEIRGSVEKQVMESIEGKEKRLGELKKSLDDTGQIIEGEKVSLQKNMENQREERQGQFNSRLEDMNNRHRQDMVNSNDKLSGELAELNQRASQEERQARYAGRVQADKIRRENDTIHGVEEKRFQDVIFNQDLRNSQALTTQKDMFKNVFDTTELVQNQKFNTQQIRHNHQTETTAKQNELTINQSKKDFEHKYKTFLDEQNMMLTNLNERVLTNADKLRDAETKHKELINERSEDEFYRGITITPIVVEDAKSYKVKIPLAPHEAASANLSGKDRNLKFTFSRNSESNIKLADGTQNKTKKAESVVKEFSVDHIINDRKIEKSYIDGLVVFNVPKK